MVERIYELIRKGEVVLFCGAGMSLAAGYPNGNDLAKQIYNSLTPFEKTQISEHLSLIDLTEAYINLKLNKRQPLVELLKTVFDKEPYSIETHQKLRKIPHIKTIITTNYDTLFERTYGNDAVVIRNDADVAYLPSTKTHIFKIHGDLTFPDSIIISKSDYTRYFDSDQKPLVWTVVKERLATKIVLFIGYNLDDMNINSIFTKIMEQLGSNARECFLLAPHLSQTKILKLAQRGIHYIDDTADNFLEGLLKNIQEHINDDLKNGWIDAETFRKVFQVHQLNPKLTTKGDKFVVSGIEPSNKQIKGTISFSVDKSNKELIERINNLFRNGHLTELELDENNTTNLSVYFNDIRFPGNGGDKMVFSPAPVASGEIDFLFGNGKEFERIKVEIFKSGDNAVFVIHLKTAKLRVTIPFQDLFDISHFSSNVQYNHGSEYGRPSDEIETFEFIQALGESGAVTIIGPKLGRYQIMLPKVEKMINEADNYLFYLKSLKTIERYFQVKFDKIGEINDSTYDTLTNMLTLADNGELKTIYKDHFSIHTIEPNQRQQIIARLTESKDNQLGSIGAECEIITFH